MKLQEQPGKDFKITVLQMLEEATGKQFNDIRKLTQEQNEFNKDKENIEKKKNLNNTVTEQNSTECFKIRLDQAEGKQVNSKTD